MRTTSQLVRTPEFLTLAYEQFEARIRLHSRADASGLKNIDPDKQALRTKAMAPILETQMRRGRTKDLKWVTTIFPTQVYADQAGMSLEEYADFVYGTMHADTKTKDPVAYWKNIEKEQVKMIQLMEGKDKVVLRGPNVDLRLSIKGRTFENACGQNNMPDGEIFTGPVEKSVDGWVRFTYPSIYAGQVVEGVELKFVEGQVLHAKAKENQMLLLRMLETDPGRAMSASLPSA